MITWKQIPEPNISGLYAEIGNRKVEAVEEERGRWTLYYYLDGVMAPANQQDFANYSGFLQAKPTAVKWLKQGE